MNAEVINLLPTRKHSFLDQKLGRIIDDESFSIACAKRGCYYLGQVVQHTEEGFFEKHQATEEQRADVINTLRNLGLAFNARLPKWRPPQGLFSPSLSEMDLQYR